MAYVAPVPRPDKPEEMTLATLRDLPLIATLVKAVQQLTARVQELEASRG
jgi:hypothetical protein